MPPIVARLAVDGSTGKNSLSLRNQAVEPVEHHPRLDPRPPPSTSTAITRSKYLLQSMTSARATVCPHCEVPPPRGNTGTPSSRAIAIAAAASSRLRGTTTPKRLDLVDRRIRRIAPAAERIEQHLASDLAPEARFQTGCRMNVERHALSRTWVSIRAGWEELRQRLSVPEKINPKNAIPGSQAGVSGDEKFHLPISDLTTIFWRLSK